jgi:hypothetical protein
MRANCRMGNLVLFRIRCRQEPSAAALATKIDRLTIEMGTTLGGFVNRQAADGINGHENQFSIK